MLGDLAIDYEQRKVTVAGQAVQHAEPPGPLRRPGHDARSGTGSDPAPPVSYGVCRLSTECCLVLAARVSLFP